MKTRTPCQFADIQPDKAGRVIFRGDKMVQCKAPEPEMPVLPVSIVKAYGFKWPPPRSWVGKEHCEVCPVWKART